MEETNNLLLKTRKLCSVLRIMAIVFFVLYLVVTIAAAIFVLREQPLQYSVAPVLYTILHGIAIEAVLILMIMGFGDIVKGESPFTMKQVGRFKTAGVVFLILVGIELFIPVDTFTAASTITNVNVAVETGSTTDVTNFNVTTLLLALASFCLALVFKYGVLLQRDTDETV